MKEQRKKQTLAVVAASCLVVLLSSTTSFATPEGSVPSEEAIAKTIAEASSIDVADSKENSEGSVAASDGETNVVAPENVDHLGGDELAAAATELADESPIEYAALVEEFTTKQAAAGHLVDAASVEAAEVDGVTIVWDEAVQIESISVEPQEADSYSVSMESSVDDQAASRNDLQSVASGAFDEPSGGVDNQHYGYCTWTRTAIDDTVESCFGKRLTTSSNSSGKIWYYGRQVKASGQKDQRTAAEKAGDAARVVAGSISLKHGAKSAHKPTIIDVRARPAKTGSNVLNQVASWPTTTSKDCTELANVSATAYGVTVSAPISKCSLMEPVVQPKTIGSIWKQPASGMRVAGSGAYGFIRANGTKIPYMADYTYVQFSGSGIYNKALNSNIRKDAGW